LFFLSKRGAEISAKLVSHFLAESLEVIQRKTSQEVLFSVTNGVVILTLQVIGPAVVLFSDVALLGILIIGLLFIDPVTAVGSIIMFTTVGLLLYSVTNHRASKLGQSLSQMTVTSNEKILEALNSYREIIVRDRRGYYTREIKRLRGDYSAVIAEMSFLPYVSKYVIETSIVLGAIMFGAVQFLLHDSIHAVSSLAMFIAAGSRIAPAVMRVQQALISIRSGLGQSASTLDLIGAIKSSENLFDSSDIIRISHAGFDPKIQVKNLFFKYMGSETNAINEVTLTIPSGSSVAVVGPSGAGKSTLIDLILGVLKPVSGTIEVSGQSPDEAVKRWPGSMSYVPQDVVIADATIRENICLGYPISEAEDELVNAAVELAQLSELILQLPLGIDTQVGEKGARFSGGQRQRLGIARAMFTKPKLLVLDEATSALDAETEMYISEAIKRLHGRTTVVMIAHRLSTIKSVDMIVYMDEGRIIATGSFEEIRNMVPDFDFQAKLMGL
jgi:ABC-type multidrug transport system fused ATPase/permease subunit